MADSGSSRTDMTHMCLSYGARSGNSPFFDFDSFISRFLGEGLARTAVGNQATFLRFAALAIELGSGGSLAGGQVGNVVVQAGAWRVGGRAVRASV